jgi:hypothetical protein
MGVMLPLAILACALVPSCAEALSNIIHIMGDDVGWNDLGYHNELISSPWIDKLALGGVRLTNHHAFKVCAPSRSGFQTGRLPWQMGYYDNSGAATPWIEVDANKLGADTRFKLLPELLKLKGYVSHAIGCAPTPHTGCDTALSAGPPLPSALSQPYNPAGHPSQQVAPRLRHPRVHPDISRVLIVPWLLPRDDGGLLGAHALHRQKLSRCERRARPPCMPWAGAPDTSRSQ